MYLVGGANSASEAVDRHGDGRHDRLTHKNRTTGTAETVPATALFILIGV